MNAFAPLRYSAFRFLAMGRFITMLGNSVAPIALAFAVLDLTGSASDLGLVVGARSLMNVLFLLVGGVVADRLPRHLVMVVSCVLAAVSQGAVAALVLTDTATIPLLIALASVNGIVSAFAFPAAAALVPQTIPAELLQPGNAINRLGINAAMILGASVGGILVAVVGPGWGLAVDAATFALAAIAFSLVRVRSVVAVKAQRPHPWRELKEGWHEFTSRTWLWVVVLGFMLLNGVHAAAIGVLGPVIADETIGRRAWGLVLAAQTVGMVLGAIVALKLRVNRLLRLGVICMLGEAPLMFLLAEAPRVVLLMPAALIAGIVVEQFGVAWESSMQRYIPADKLARVYSYDALGSFLAIPLGQTLAGPAVEAWGTSTALLGASVLTVVAVVFMLLSRDVRTLPASPPQAPAAQLATADA
ncbi:MFS transporter [Catelliglobosispora koreensis]|uniref:MFS transporter n=1 Tax=Catelliglobosispora koreensis TaxID=129052 RepID=UPI00036EBF49|nr:MFS transporter [Catelliglobosispora koreensis]